MCPGTALKLVTWGPDDMTAATAGSSWQRLGSPSTVRHILACSSSGVSPKGRHTTLVRQLPISLARNWVRCTGRSHEALLFSFRTQHERQRIGRSCLPQLPTFRSHLGGSSCLPRKKKNGATWRSVPIAPAANKYGVQNRLEKAGTIGKKGLHSVETRRMSAPVRPVNWFH